ncbi:MAG: glycosyltransferase family 4 protein [Candidatus Korobacteraceae bacterium]
MRVLHVVKTSDGAGWAANQAAVLARLGVEVHVALPCAAGRTVAAWRQAGAVIHIADLSLPVTHPARFGVIARAVQRLVEEVQPDLIHSHFVTSTLALRLALGKHHRVPRIFQVPGPLHLEHWHTRLGDLATAGEADFWIGSSCCINEHYRRAGTPKSRLFLSYPGWRVREFSTHRQYYLHRRLGVDANTSLVGNINVMYPPKYFLGQTVGLKCHEDVIDALGLIVRSAPHVKGVLVGDSYGLGAWYEQRLKKRARRVASDKILLPGLFAGSEVTRSWPDFDCALHVPLSENCGGVLEPLLAGVPVVASNVGGIPEVVIEGMTGKLVPVRDPKMLSRTVIEVLADLEHYRKLASNGRRLVQHMFDVERTGKEIHEIYYHILHGGKRPQDFNSHQYLRQLSPTPGMVPMEATHACSAAV